MAPTDYSKWDKLELSDEDEDADEGDDEEQVQRLGPDFYVDDEEDEEDAAEFEKLRAELASKKKPVPHDLPSASATQPPSRDMRRMTVNETADSDDDDDDDDDSNQRPVGSAPPADPKRMHAEDLIGRLTKAEQLGEEVLSERAQMVDLDRARNANREALAALRQITKAEGAEVAAAHKFWVLQGDVFLRRPHGNTRAMLEVEQKRLDEEIDALRTSVKQKTSQLCELDPSIDGGTGLHKSFVGLTGVSASELQGMLR